MKERLSPKQQALVDFLYDWLDQQECSPSYADIENGTGMKPAAISDCLRYLRLKRCVGTTYETYVDGGRIFAIDAVAHPTKGIKQIQPAFYDVILGASYFAEDLATMAPIIERKCLNCRSRFETRGRFNRLCHKCAKDGDQSQQVAPGGYVSNMLAISAGNPAAGMGHFKRGTR